MDKVFVDTNILLRYLTNDFPEQAQHLENLIERSNSGEIRLVVNSMVFAEIVWTLQSFYKYPKDKIDEIVSAIVASEAFEIDERDILLQALEDFHSLNIDFIDAYIASWMQKKQLYKIFTLNKKDFKRISGIELFNLK